MLAFAIIAIFTVRGSHAADEEPLPAVDTTIARGLEFLASQQKPDGSFGTSDKPATTALALMSFLACGHTPNAGKFDANVGKFGANVRLTIDYLVAQAQSDNFIKQEKPSTTHALVTLALAQAYGVDDSEAQRKRIAAALSASSRQIVAAQEPRKGDGRKTDSFFADADLISVYWSLIAMRACQDVGIAIPRQAFQRAGKFVLRCYSPESKSFAPKPGAEVTPGATGAGLLCLRLLDGPQPHPDTQPILAALSATPVDGSDTLDQFGNIYIVTRAAFAASDSTWRAVAKVTYDKLIKLQQGDGGWSDASESHGGNRTYATSMALLALSLPYRLVPTNQH